ncbi:glycosyltransferase family 2 protein [Arthrobacter sp. 2YAF22_2]|uniref:glycosyltransferase family 2 protein n=1 Tax=Arthrobacter sp. 2YAF22_2 TaxID=3233029 RepID=UPI003F9109F4
MEIDHGNITETNFRVARVISQLAVAGVPMLLANLASEMSELLGTELMAELQSLGNRTFHSDLERESFSINCRRAGLRGFSPAKRWINTFSTPLVTDESVSIILATRRPQLLPRILQQIENQSATEIEVIIGLHGHTEPDTEVVRMLEKFRFEAKLILFSEECSLGSVLNGLTRAAGGRFISKMDDDDWYAPHHIEDLLLGKSYSGAGLVGAPVEFTYIESADLTTQRGFEKECFTEHVAGGTILLSKELLQEVGGWRATRSAVDRGLIDAVLASGERVYRIHGQNYLMHRRSPVPGVMAHTWSAGDEVFLRNCINQWDGFVPPPQFEGSASWFEPPGRLPSYQSYFDMASTRTKGEPRALRHLLRDEK